MRSGRGKPTITVTAPVASQFSAAPTVMSPRPELLKVAPPARNFTSSSGTTVWKANWPPAIVCGVTHTTEETHRIIAENLGESAVYGGRLSGRGPRYCPSIEDKVVRFADKSSHQVFLEPEGLDDPTVYPNGISTSVSEATQMAFLRTMPGLEQVEVFRFGYAIEYDYFDPRALKSSFETRDVKGLFFAGQINGTTGYEEAAAQGLLAGLNAGRFADEQEGWAPRRDQAYLGVLVDDLSTLGTKEPYRMFTSRAEYRLMLREDNADLRLTEQGRELGLVDDERWARFNEKLERIEQERQRLKTTWVNSLLTPSSWIMVHKYFGRRIVCKARRMLSSIPI